MIVSTTNGTYPWSFVTEIVSLNTRLHWRCSVSS